MLFSLTIICASKIVDENWGTFGITNPKGDCTSNKLKGLTSFSSQFDYYRPNFKMPEGSKKIPKFSKPWATVNASRYAHWLE